MASGLPPSSSDVMPATLAAKLSMTIGVLAGWLSRAFVQVFAYQTEETMPSASSQEKGADRS